MIAVTELTGMYRFLFQSHRSLMLEFGVLTALLYLLMSYPLSLVARRMESRLQARCTLKIRLAFRIVAIGLHQ